jgi:hypothetical protein
MVFGEEYNHEAPHYALFSSFLLHPYKIGEIMFLCVLIFMFLGRSWEDSDSKLNDGKLVSNLICFSFLLEYNFDLFPSI